MRRTMGIVGAGMAAVAAVAGCSHNSTHRPVAQNDAKAVEAAYSTTTAQKTAKITIDVKAAQGNGTAGQTAALHATGAVDSATKSGELTLSVPQGGTEPVVFTAPGTVYEKPPAQALAKAGIRTPWLSINMNEIARKKLGAQLPQNTPDSPLDQLGYIKGVSDKVKNDGSATVAGVQTTHYSVTIDLDKAATAKTSPAVKKLEGILGSRTMPAQVWLDKAGRIRKMQLTEKMKNPPSTNGAAPGPITLNATIMLTDLGAPVHITVPPKSQTTDITNKVLQQS